MQGIIAVRRSDGQQVPLDVIDVELCTTLDIVEEEDYLVNWVEYIGIPLAKNVNPAAIVILGSLATGNPDVFGRAFRWLTRNFTFVERASAPKPIRTTKAAIFTMPTADFLALSPIANGGSEEFIDSILGGIIPGYRLDIRAHISDGFKRSETPVWTLVSQDGRVYAPTSLDEDAVFKRLENASHIPTLVVT